MFLCEHVRLHINTYQPFPSVSQLPAALRLPQKNTPLDCWSRYPVDFVICLTTSAPPKPFVAVSQLPAALRLPQKKHAPGFLEHVLGGTGGTGAPGAGGTARRRWGNRWAALHEGIPY